MRLNWYKLVDLYFVQIDDFFFIVFDLNEVSKTNSISNTNFPMFKKMYVLEKFDLIFFCLWLSSDSVFVFSLIVLIIFFI